MSRYRIQINSGNRKKLKKKVKRNKNRFLFFSSFKWDCCTKTGFSHRGFSHGANKAESDVNMTLDGITYHG